LERRNERGSKGIDEHDESKLTQTEDGHLGTGVKGGGDSAHTEDKQETNDRERQERKDKRTGDLKMSEMQIAL
jgi:hypothetical protein